MDMKNLREWFKLIYEVVLVWKMVQEWIFISFFGLKETIELISNKIK